MTALKCVHVNADTAALFNMVLHTHSISLPPLPSVSLYLPLYHCLSLFSILLVFLHLSLHLLYSLCLSIGPISLNSVCSFPFVSINSPSFSTLLFVSDPGSVSLSLFISLYTTLNFSLPLFAIHQSRLFSSAFYWSYFPLSSHPSLNLSLYR